MATVYDFARRLADSQDWTPGERAQLREMGLQLGVARSDLDIVFGRSDDGDPWCVVTDRAGEVLLHVARIAGCFIVHAAREDQIVEGRDLWSAAFQALGHALKDRRGILLPFSTDALTQNAILAFMLTAALRGELGRLPGLSEFLGAMGHDRDHGQAGHSDPTAPGHDGAATADPATRHVAAADHRTADSHAHAAAGQQAPSTVSAIQSETAAAAEAIALAEAQANGAAGPGGGAPVKPAELVVGGKGEDRIQLGEHVVAVGGDGADTFVLPLPTAGSRGPAFMGAILDFHPAEGDRLAFGGGGRVTMTSDQPVADVRAERGGPPVPSDVALAGRKIGYDTNGDHVEDGYVLVSNAAHGWVEQTFGHADAGPAAHTTGAGATTTTTSPATNTPAPPSMAIPGPYHMGD